MQVAQASTSSDTPEHGTESAEVTPASQVPATVLAETELCKDDEKATVQSVAPPNPKLGELSDDGAEEPEEEDLETYFAKLVEEYNGKPMMKKALLNEFGTSGLRDRLNMITEVQTLIDDQAPQQQQQQQQQQESISEASETFASPSPQHRERRGRGRGRGSDRRMHSGESKESVRGTHQTDSWGDEGFSSSEESDDSFPQHNHNNNNSNRSRPNTNQSRSEYPLGTSTLGVLDLDDAALDCAAVDEAWASLLNETLTRDKRQVLMDQYQNESSARARYHMLLEFTSYLRQPQQQSQNDQADTGNNEAGLGLRRRVRGSNGGAPGSGSTAFPSSQTMKEPVDLREMFGDLSSIKGNNGMAPRRESAATRGARRWAGFGVPLPGLAMIAIVGLALFRFAVFDISSVDEVLAV